MSANNAWKTIEEVASFEQGHMKTKARVVDRDNKRFLDLRSYYLDDTGEWKPTKRGIAIPEDLLDDYRKTVNALCDAAIELREAGR